MIGYPPAKFRLGPRSLQWVLLFAFLGLVSSSVINYTPYRLTCDELYYLGRAIWMNHAVYHFNLSRIHECLIHTPKGPIMALLDLPWGRTGGSDWGLGLAFVGLALLIWVLVFATYLVCIRCATPPIGLLLAGVSVGLTPFLRLSSGAMMVDVLLGWCIALTLMLIPLEYLEPQTGWWPSVLRGLLWGFVIDIGMLSKVTFAFFLVSVGVVLLAIRQRRSGNRPLLYTLMGCAAGSTPAILMWWKYGLYYLAFAMAAAWGKFAVYFNVPGMTARGYLWRFMLELGWALIPLILLVALFVRGLFMEKQGRLVRLLPVSIILAYLVIASRSQNRDPRFTIPIMIALPLCLSQIRSGRTAPSAAVVAPILAGMTAVILCTIPMVGRPDLAPIQRAGDLLKTLSQGRPITLEIATDGPEANIDTFELARQLGGDGLRPVKLHTLVYDVIDRRTVEEGLRRIDAANYVLFLKPGLSPSPEWMRRYAQNYRARCEAIGTLLHAEVSVDFEVFKIP